jgi:hypothetical protein
MKLLTIGILVLVLMGCTPLAETKVKRDVYLPDELSHCKLYDFVDSQGNILYVLHCPNATTSTNTTGKFKKSVTVVSE